MKDKVEWVCINDTEMKLTDKFNITIAKITKHYATIKFKTYSEKEYDNFLSELKQSYEVDDFKLKIIENYKGELK